MTLEEKIIQKLIKKSKTLAVAESCTGGLLSNRLTNVPGSSKTLIAGLVTYSNVSKSKLLGISSKLIKKHGAVSAEVATKMAKKVRKRLKANFGIGISGIAGPTGGSKAKPVGLTFIALSSKKHTVCLENRFKGSRVQIKSQAVQKALVELYKIVYLSSIAEFSKKA